MTEHQSFLKDKADCECGCGLYGTLKVSPNSKGHRCVRGCKCRPCMGRQSKRKGQKKQAAAVTALGIPRSSIHPGHEEFLGGAIRVEVKAGGQILPAYTAFKKCEDQSEHHRPIGDHRPFAAVFMPDGESDGIACIRLSQLHEFAAGLVENWGSL